MVNYIANSAYSSIAPFYPLEAMSKGVPSQYVGYIFSGYSISMCVFSPVFGIMLTKLGRKNVLIIGCLCESAAMISFGFFFYVQDPAAYASLSFLCRFVEGFGNGCLNSATSSIISHDYENNMGNLMGLTQTFTGLGMLSGPILGSLLFEAGGFTLPFFVTGGLLFSLIFPVSCYIRNDKPVQIGGTTDRELILAQSQGQALSFFGLLGKFKILTCALCMSTSLMSLTFKEPLFQVRLK
jgi:MFS family permease